MTNSPLSVAILLAVAVPEKVAGTFRDTDRDDRHTPARLPEARTYVSGWGRLSTL